MNKHLKKNSHVSRHPLAPSRRLLILAFAFAGLLLVALGTALIIEHDIRQRAAEPGELLKIGFTTDWEYGTSKQLKHKLTNRAPELLQEIVRHFNEDFNPDIVIAGGDYIESSSVPRNLAIAQLQEVTEIFSQVRAPKMYALGNHDMRSLSKEDVKGILGIEESHSYQDIGAWRIVVFDTNFNKEDDSDRKEKNYVLGYVSQAELAWLDEALNTDRPTVVFSHHSVLPTINADGVGLTDNIFNSAAVREIFERHENIIASFSGHTPLVQYREHNGIYYFIADTLVNRSGLGAFADIELRYNPFSSKAEIAFHHFGLREQEYRVTAWMRSDAEENNRYMFRKYLSQKSPFE